MNDYPERLAHKTPAWVKPGSFFHLRVRVSRDQGVPLTTPAIASRLLDTFSYYHRAGRWFCRLVVLMPDHLHAILAFDREAQMSQIIGQWKS